MKLAKNEYTVESLINFLKESYKKKVTGMPFTVNDIAQYIRRGQIPYRYGGQFISVKREEGVKIITLKERK